MTRYVVKLARTGEFWAGANRFVKDVIGARWFSTWTEAELAGLRELPDPVSSWSVQLIEGE